MDRLGREILREGEEYFEKERACAKAIITNRSIFHGKISEAIARR